MSVPSRRSVVVQLRSQIGDESDTKGRPRAPPRGRSWPRATRIAADTLILFLLVTLTSTLVVAELVLNDRLVKIGAGQATILAGLQRALKADSGIAGLLGLLPTFEVLEAAGDSALTVEALTQYLFIGVVSIFMLVRAQPLA